MRASAPLPRSPAGAAPPPRPAVAGSAGPRAKQVGTWIAAETQAAYTERPRRGHAQSVEGWRDDQLVGGLYGVAVGEVFCGESMFSRATDASKVALVELCQQGYRLIDGQEAVTFLKRVVDCIENPDRLLLEV